MSFLHSLKFHLFVAVAIVMAGCLGLLAFLNYCNFSKDLHSFVQSRFLVLADDLQNSVEYGLNLGLGLAELKNIQPLIEEAGRKDADIEELMIVDPHGGILFHSDPGRVGQQIAGEWFEPVSRKSDNGPWYSGTTDRQYMILPVVNQFNIRVGFLVLSYPSTLLSQPRAFMGSFLAQRSLLIFLVAAFLALLVIFGLAKGLLADVNELADDLARLKREDATGRAQRFLDPEFVKLFDAFVSQYRLLQHKKDL